MIASLRAVEDPRRAIRSRIEALKKFARNLRGYLYGILARCRWPLHTSLLECINNKIKVIKRMAYSLAESSNLVFEVPQGEVPR